MLKIGYQAPGTIGRKLIRMIEEDKEDFISLSDRLYNREDIKCKLVHIDGYSGHADQEDLVHWVTGNLSREIPRNIILNHGTNEMRMHLAKRLEHEYEGVTIVTPTRDLPVVEIAQPE